jgi:hypothetical protein
LKGLVRISLLLLGVLIAGTAVSAQVDPFNRDRQREEDAKIVKEMLAKAQSEREKKEHKELLERADIALELSDELEKMFEEGQHLAADDKRLVELEKVVKKIRDDLGGDEEDEDEATAMEEGPKDVKDAFLALRKSILQLADEVKKTTRFSISVAAIRSSNSVLKLVRFLRFRN